jgi:dephospho-CoA kinase
MKRDGVDAAQAQARMDNQMPQQEKAKYARYILHNNSNKKKLRAELEQVWQQFAAE